MLDKSFYLWYINRAVGNDYISDSTKLLRGVAQLVARLLWEQDVGSSSLFTPTNKGV